MPNLVQLRMQRQKSKSKSIGTIVCEAVHGMHPGRMKINRNGNSTSAPLRILHVGCHENDIYKHLEEEFQTKTIGFDINSENVPYSDRSFDIVAANATDRAFDATHLAITIQERVMVRAEGHRYLIVYHTEHDRKCEPDHPLSLPFVFREITIGTQCYKHQKFITSEVNYQFPVLLATNNQIVKASVVAIHHGTSEAGKMTYGAIINNEIKMFYNLPVQRSPVREEIPPL